MNTFQLTENFQLYDENYKPYGIFIQSSSNYWHKHAHCTPDGYCVGCTGNKYFLQTPPLSAFRASVAFSFGHVDRNCGISLYFGYDPDTFCGHELRIDWKKDTQQMRFILFSITGEVTKEIASRTEEGVAFPSFGDTLHLDFELNAGGISAHIGAAEVFFDGSFAANGYFGFSRPHFIGSVTFSEVSVCTDLVPEMQGAPLLVEIPMVNGGTMPLTMEYSVFKVKERNYITATLAGGPQYRTEENFHPYPCNKQRQYCVEGWYLTNPYFTCNGKRFLLKRGAFNTVDPGLAWKEILFKIIPYSRFPLSVTVPIDCGSIETLGFGYDYLSVSGYGNQGGSAEFRFSPAGTYLGQVFPEDFFELISPADKKAVQLIPETVYDYETVKAHFEGNHYFAEGEVIRFRISSNTDKRYITYKAELQDVFGTYMEELPVCDLEISHAPLPVGVYRVFLTVYYGMEIFKTVDTVFEVFDEAGERCAPTESGLPFQFSMPNEQQYLDHDAFDPWRYKKSCNSEHFYPCSAFTGHVAEYKRTWELTKLFGRKWYVWFSDHRTMVDNDIEKHPEIMKHADFMYYPSEYEWAVLRSDFTLPWLWKRMPKLRALLDQFLCERPGAAERIGLIEGAPVTDRVIAKLHEHYQTEWYAYAGKALTAAFEKQNEMFRAHNPKLKRACYGPFNLYMSPLRTSKLSEMYGFERGEALSETIYTGFAQLEDYANSCAYQTYYSAFAVGTALVDSPNLTIYPEQYGGSPGGCIDGAVYFAHPPIGKIICPPWFSTTHAREFVYNTPRITADGFSYWNTYGFMKWSFDEESNDIFIRNWKYVVQHRPERPLKAAAFVCSFNTMDDRFDAEFPSHHRCAYNVSEEGIGYLYETMRMAGLPAGFFSDWRGLDHISAMDTDVLVIPSTEGVDGHTLQRIRELHGSGVSLIATGRVDGLEDLFGVKSAPQNVQITELSSAAGTRESVYPVNDTGRYVSDGAECLLFASGVPAIFTHGRTALFNISPMSMGRTWFFRLESNARASNSTLLRETALQLVRSLSHPIAESRDCGITLFRTKAEETLLLATDYSRHDDLEVFTERERTVLFNEKCFRDAESIDGKPLRRLISPEGILEGIVVTLRQHESALIRLK